MSVCAEAGAAAEGADGLREALLTLVDHSLVYVLDAEASARVDPSHVRYGLLETVREYGLEQLERHGEAAWTQERHLAWCLALAERAEQELMGSAQAAWLDRLQAEHDNVRVALGWACRCGTGAEGLRLAGAMWRFWYIRGYLSEGRRWLDRALAGGVEGFPAAWAKALNGAGNLAYLQGDYAPAVVLHEQALALLRALGDKQGVARSLTNLGMVAYLQGDSDGAVARYEEGLALKRELGDTRGIAYALSDLAGVAYRRGDLERAASQLEEGVALLRSLQDTWALARSLDNLGMVARQQGQYERAAALHEESLAFARVLGDKHGIARALDNLGAVAEYRGELERALALYEESLQLSRELGDRQGIATSLYGVGHVLHEQGDDARAAALLAEGLLINRDLGEQELVAEGLEGLARVAWSLRQAQQAARLSGAAQAQRERCGASLSAERHVDVDRMAQALRTALGEEAFAAAWAAGGALPVERAIAEAVDSVTDVPPARP